MPTRDRIQTANKISISKSNFHKRKNKQNKRQTEAEIENNQLSVSER